MAAKAPVIFVLGAGPGVGSAVGRLFASKGYKVALASRSQKESDSTENQLNIPIDFSKPEELLGAFAKVKEKLGIPSVVVYNGSFPSIVCVFHNIDVL
jgi:NAD(P)-dependent dehydrogenase (short-subunit alcohol dehydrogenase family)